MSLHAVSSMFLQGYSLAIADNHTFTGEWEMSAKKRINYMTRI
jgi:hypothetical protein